MMKNYAPCGEGMPYAQKPNISIRPNGAKQIKIYR